MLKIVVYVFLTGYHEKCSDFQFERKDYHKFWLDL